MGSLSICQQQWPSGNLDQFLTRLWVNPPPPRRAAAETSQSRIRLNPKLDWRFRCNRMQNSPSPSLCSPIYLITFINSPHGRGCRSRGEVGIHSLTHIFIYQAVSQGVNDNAAQLGSGPQGGAGGVSGWQRGQTIRAPPLRLWWRPLVLLPPSNLTFLVNPLCVHYICPLWSFIPACFAFRPLKESLRSQKRVFFPLIESICK